MDNNNNYYSVSHVVTVPRVTTNQLWVAGDSQCKEGGGGGGVVKLWLHCLDEERLGYDQVKSVVEGGQNLKISSAKWVVVKV